jgi:hypothetical protein
MGKIVRLTESDLVRIVKRVINEGTSSGPYTVNGKKYNIMVFGNGEIAYDDGMGRAVTDKALIKKLNGLSGLDMHPSGSITKIYLLKNSAEFPKLYKWFMATQY